MTRSPPRHMPPRVVGRAKATARRGGTDSSGVAAPRPAAARRSQEERSSATQQRLCQAAVDLLSEVGYERLTTAQIAQRAGVSKGAQAHHYPSKDDMLLAAFRHLLSQWEERREAYAKRLGQNAPMEELLLAIWHQVFGRPDYLASLEVMLAARHNPTLRDRLREVLKGWTLVRDETFRALVPLDDPEELATFLQVNFCVLRGLAVYEGLSDDKDLPQRVLQMWTGIASGYVAQRSGSATRPHSSPHSRPTSRAAPRKPSTRRSSP